MTDSELAGARARLHATITGSVQGVGFRYFVVDNARPRGLTGWVRNRSDGSVEIVAEGPRLTLDRLVAQLQRGPQRAVIESFECDWLEPTGEYRGFSVRRL